MRTVTDPTGHTLSLPKEVARIGTPGISLVSLIVVLAGPQKLAAITPEVQQNAWLMRVAPMVSRVAVPFSRPAGVNIESLLSTRADIVVLWAGNTAFAERIEDAGVPVFSLGYRNPSEMQAAVRMLGRALGARESQRAELFVRLYQDNLARVAHAVGGVPANSRPRVYYASIDPLLTEGKDSMVDAWINAAGGINVAARAGVQSDGRVQLEDVLLWDPELIVTYGPAQRDAILSDPRWQRVTAVRNARVYASPAGVNAWCTRATEAALQVLWAAKLFHPGRTKEIDIAQEVRSFYKTFYGYSLGEVELAHVLDGRAPPP